MAETPTPEQDPVVTKSLSVPLLVSTLILMLSLVWALYDEVWAMRPWKQYQADFIELYKAHLTKVKPEQAGREQEVKESGEYAELSAQVAEAEAAAAEQIDEIDRIVRNGVTPRMRVSRQAYQTLRSEVDAINYQIETTESESSKQSLQEDIDEIRQRDVEVELALEDGSGGTETVKMKYAAWETEFRRLQDRRVELQAQRARLTEPASALRRQRDAYLNEHLFGLTATGVDGLINKMDNFGIDIKQIHLNDIDLVDRCESCHLGTREPVMITAADMGGRAEFVSHPSRDLLDIHDPERFGCTPCHNGNGRATRSITKGHGRHKFWLWPMWEKENTEAGCHQCHAREIVTEHADVLNKGRNLFMNRGCWGCHRLEGFDSESDRLAAVRQQMQVMRDERAAIDKEQRFSLEQGDLAEDNETAQAFYGRGEELRLRLSKLDAEFHTLRVEQASVAQEAKKFGPSLREIRVKDRKEWIPVWLKDPHEFRPGSKMPVFRLLDEEIQAISAYLWQNALDAELEQHAPGNATNGKELFETRGCMGCHSMGDGEERFGGTFAANLSRVGEKTNYNFLVRWISNPHELTPDPDQGPDDVRLLPIMPNLRLSPQGARDIASYLIERKTDATYPAADFMDDPELAAQGLPLIRHYGCSGCHEIRGLETEGRIGTELTTEGSKPIERLDFALLTHEAEHDGWYNHKGFFDRKLQNPAIYDEGKIRPHLEKLRMPNFNLTDDEITALTTFLLGAVESVLPEQYRYLPEDQRADVQKGWWIVSRYNCTGCHQIKPGDVTSFMTIPRYDDPDWAEQFPPQLYGEGARVQPDWLLGFLENPALSESDIHRNGLRQYLEARMPSFGFSDRQVGTLMRFFMARSTQPHPYIPDQIEPLTPAEQTMGRQLFTSRGAPCLRCHMTGSPAHDRNATAPNFLTATARLKPDWTFRWMIEPAMIAPGTAMPSELFRIEGGRWIFNGPLPRSLRGYEKDHAQLLVRYMFQLDAAEVRRLTASGVQ